MKARKKYAVCVDNTGYQASLILKKLYEVVPDERAAQDDFLRVTGTQQLLNNLPQDLPKMAY